MVSQEFIEMEDEKMEVPDTFVEVGEFDRQLYTRTISRNVIDQYFRRSITVLVSLAHN